MIADRTLRSSGGRDASRVRAGRRETGRRLDLGGMKMTTTTTSADGCAADKPRLVFFHSRASGRARRVDGYIANVLQRHQNHDTFRLQRVLVEEHPDLAARFGVDGVPTLFVIESNRVRARLENPRGTQDIEAELAPWLRPGRARTSG
jgi:thioredoxin family protein